MKRLTEEWLKAAKDDLDVINRIIEDSHLTHIVAFHAQQCVEKILKALYEEHEIDIPKIHNLVTLYGKIEKLVPLNLNLTYLKTLDSLYIEARYPVDLGLLPNGKPTREESRDFYQFAKELHEKIAFSLHS